MIKAALLLLLTTSAFSIIVQDPPAIYKYSYNVQDPTTGDNKSQEESRHGDVVTGSYSVLDPDGSKRVVKYTADPKNGFKATIETEPYSQPLNIPIGTRILPIAYNDDYKDNAPLLFTTAQESAVPFDRRPKQYVGGRRTYFTPEDLIRKHQARNQYYVLNQYF